MTARELARVLLHTDIDTQVCFFHQDIGYFGVDTVEIEPQKVGGPNLSVLRNENAQIEHARYLKEGGEECV